jgi:hypothetical protein
MNTIIVSATLSTTLMIIYYLTKFREETKNENYSEFFVSIVLFLLLYIAMFILILNIINVYNKSFSKSINTSSLDNVTIRRAREDTFARLLARNASDPDTVINPLFERSPQFLSGPFGPNNPRANQIAYTFYNS